MNNQQCKHYWEPSSIDKNGNAEFRPLHGALVTHARCKFCNARTWFTPQQWAQIPVMEEPKSNGRPDVPPSPPVKPVA